VIPGVSLSVVWLRSANMAEWIGFLFGVEINNIVLELSPNFPYGFDDIGHEPNLFVE